MAKTGLKLSVDQTRAEEKWAVTINDEKRYFETFTEARVAFSAGRFIDSEENSDAPEIRQES